jgi:hypothetical protein
MSLICINKKNIQSSDIFGKMFSTCLIGYTYLSRFRQGCENTRVENKVKESSMVNKLSYLHLIKLKTKLIQLTYHSKITKIVKKIMHLLKYNGTMMV